MSKKKSLGSGKIGLLGCIMVAIGSIIGAGIFGTLPEAINDIGAGVIIAFIAGAIYMIAIMVPNMYSTSVIPKSGGAFLYSAKLIHPGVGLFMTYLGLVHPLLIASFAKMFANYFVALFPSMEPYKIAWGVALLVFFSILAWFGNNIFAKFSTGMVVILLFAIALYLVLGFPNIDPSKATVGQIFNSSVTLTSMGAAIVLVSSTLSGASNVAQIADDLKNPSRDIPLTLIIAPVVVAIIYILMAIVTVGCMPEGELTSLSVIASGYMGSALLAFFIIGGPLFGILTSMVPIIMMTNAIIYAAAENKVFPSFMAKKNKHGTPMVILILVMGTAIFLLASGISYGVLMMVFSMVTGLCSIPSCLVPFFLRKRYPYTCKHPGFKVNTKLMYVVSTFAICVAVFLFISTISSLGLNAWIAFLVILGISLIYLFFRIRYLKSKGYDLLKELGEPYPEWEAMEAKWKEAETNS